MSMTLEHKKHVAFWVRCLRMLPQPYTSGDTQRMTLGYFCLSGLDLLGVAQSKIPEEERKDLIDWIYAQQIAASQGGGFRGSPCHATSRTTPGPSHITMCYNALQTLAILRDDFARVDRASLKKFIASCQHVDGSFSPSPGQAERDARFVYCAFALCDMLDAWSSINTDAAVHFLLQCRNHDGGFGQGPGQESQGGSTFCALASLAMSSRLDRLENRELTIDWLCSRQQSGSGFNGRPEKPTDTCYSFWCGASLAVSSSLSMTMYCLLGLTQKDGIVSAQILGVHALIDSSSDVSWLLSAQTRVGGIAKTPEDMPDVMHSYLSHAALAMHIPSSDEADNEVSLRLEGLQRLEPRWNLSEMSAEWLRNHIR